MYDGEVMIAEFLVAKPERKRPLGRPRHGCKENIKMHLQEGGGTDWIELAHVIDRFAAILNVVMNLRIT